MIVDLVYKNKTIFNFNIEDNLQLLGYDLALKNKIVTLIDKVINNYRFKDFELEYMDDSYPRIETKDNAFVISDYEVILIDNLESLVDQLIKKKNSIVEKYILTLEDELEVSNIIYRIEDEFLKLSSKAEEIINGDLGLNEINLSLDLENLNFKKIYRSFFKVNYYDKLNNRKGPWQLNSLELIDLFVALLDKLLKENKNYILILNQLDTRLDNYNYLIESLIDLSEKNYNFTFWNIPAYQSSIIKTKDYFDKTYICYSENIIKLENFDLTYESICRNYPSNNFPTEKEVITSLLTGLNKYKNNKALNPTKENLILSIFLDLLDLEFNFKNIDKLDNLEKNYIEINM